MVDEPERMWSWRGHAYIVAAVIVLAVVLTILLVTEVVSLGGGASGIKFSHEDLVGDFVTMLWLSSGVFVVLSTGLLAVGLRKGTATLIPYVVAVASIPATWLLLDKYF